MPAAIAPAEEDLNEHGLEILDSSNNKQQRRASLDGAILAAIGFARIRDIRVPKPWALRAAPNQLGRLLGRE
jgi:hypothetical protein